MRKKKSETGDDSDEKSLLLRLSGAMRVLDVGPTKIRQLVREGKIEKVPLGRRCVRYTRASVEAQARPGPDAPGPGRPRGGEK